MADVRKLELVNKRMLVADGVFGQTDAILGGFTDNLSKTLKEFQTRTKAQIDAEYEEVRSTPTKNKLADIASKAAGVFKATDVIDNVNEMINENPIGGLFNEQ